MVGAAGWATFDEDEVPGVPPPPHRWAGATDLNRVANDAAEVIVCWCETADRLLRRALRDPNALPADIHRSVWAFLDDVARSLNGRRARVDIEVVAKRVGRLLRAQVDAVLDAERSMFDGTVSLLVGESLASALDRVSDMLWERLGEIIRRRNDQPSRPFETTVLRNEWRGPASEQMTLSRRPNSEWEPDDGDGSEDHSYDLVDEASAERGSAWRIDEDSCNVLATWLLHLGDCVLRGVDSALLGGRPHSTGSNPMRRSSRPAFKRSQRTRVFVCARMLATVLANGEFEVVSDKRRRERLRALDVPVWARARTLEKGVVAVSRAAIHGVEPALSVESAYQAGRRTGGQLIFLLEQAAEAAEHDELHQVFSASFDRLAASTEATDGDGE